MPHNGLNLQAVSQISQSWQAGVGGKILQNFFVSLTAKQNSFSVSGIKNSRMFLTKHSKSSNGLATGQSR